MAEFSTPPLSEEDKKLYVSRVYNDSLFATLGYIMDRKAGEMIPRFIRETVGTIDNDESTNFSRLIKGRLAEGAEDTDDTLLITETATDLARRVLYRETGWDRVAWDIARCAIQRVSTDTHLSPTPPSRLKGILHSHTSTQLHVHQASIADAEKKREEQRRSIEETHPSITIDITSAFLDIGMNEQYFSHEQYPTLLNAIIYNSLQAEFYCRLFEVNVLSWQEIGELAQKIKISKSELGELIAKIQELVKQYRQVL